MARKDFAKAMQILKETAEKFKLLDDECNYLVRNREKYTKKLQERTQLLINLPSQIVQALSGVGGEVGLKHVVINEVRTFAAIAKDALKRTLEKEDTWEMGLLLIHPWHNIGDKNDLEKLIELLEDNE